MRHYWTHLLVVCLVAALHLLGLSGFVQTTISDFRIGSLSRAATGDLAVVAIDPPSLERIGVWPWPRSLHSKLIEQLERAGVGEVFFDVDFSSASNSADDAEFADTLQNAQISIVLPTFEQLVGDKLHTNRPNPLFAKATWPALVNVSADRDGDVRKYPFGNFVDGEFIPSMAAIVAAKIEQNISPFMIDFGIRSQTVPTFSYADVLSGEPSILNRLKGKKVIVGATAIELGDRFNIPGGHVLSGPMLQVLASESILQGRTLRALPWHFALPAIAGIIAFMLLVWRRARPAAKIVTLMIVSASVEAAAFVTLAYYPLVLPTSDIHLTILGYFAAIALYEIDIREVLKTIANARFERIAMSLGDGLICANVRQDIIVWNPGAAVIFGYEADQIIGRPLSELFVDESKGPLLAAVAGPGSSPPELGQEPVIELTGLRKNGETFPAEVRFSRWAGSEGLQIGAILRDVSDRKREADRIRYLAEYDTLTGLANRNTLQERLRIAIKQSDTNSPQVALLVVGIDHFQQINDVHGHLYGDDVIRAAADKIRSIAKNCEIIARLGADEFAIVIREEAAYVGAEFLAQTLSSAFLADGLVIAQRAHRIKVSIGIAVHKRGANAESEILGNAHLALSRAKKTQAKCYVSFVDDFRSELHSRLLLESELYLALERNEFELFYQPQVQLSDHGLAGAEALIRWRHPVRGLVAPGEFMPVVNSSPISEPVAKWVLETAVKQAKTWLDDGHEVRIGINLSPCQMQSGGDFAAEVEELLSKFDCPARLIELEVTEDILLGNEEAVACLQKLRSLGISIAFDDFGTGYASLSYLKKFPLDTLKVDRSFVSNLWDDPHNLPIVTMTAGLCGALGLSLIAEGIEDQLTADQLALVGCIEGQGYHFGRPMPAPDFAQQFLHRASAASGTAA